MELLHGHNLGIDQAARFASALEFRRAFKRWTGRTPREAREQIA